MGIKVCYVCRPRGNASGENACFVGHACLGSDFYRFGCYRVLVVIRLTVLFPTGVSNSQNSFNTLRETRLEYLNLIG